MNRILLRADEPAPDGTVVLGDDRARHVREVLRATPGRVLRVGVLDGALGEATLVEDGPRGVVLSCRWGEVPEPARVDLVLALPRPKVLRRLWAQLAALGVHHVHLCNAERVERSYFDSHYVQPATYQPLLVEGLAQAGDTRIPRVSVHKSFRVLVEDVLGPQERHTARWVAHPGSTGTPLVAASAGDATRVMLAVGPEGGWNAFELALLARHGFSPVTLGARTLRTDTATVALLALVHARIDAAVAGGSAQT